MFPGAVVAAAAMLGAEHVVSAGWPEQVIVTAAGNERAPAVVGVTVSMAMAAPPGMTEPAKELAISVKLEPAVNVAVPDVPPGVVTIIVWAPAVAALAAMANVAVIVVLLATVTFDAVIPAPPKLSVVGEANPVPVIVTVGLVPSTPLFGLREVIVGTGRFTRNVWAGEVPDTVVTETFCAPSVAVGEI